MSHSPKVTAFVSHYDCSRHDTGWGHPDHQGRLPALMRAVYRDMLTLFDPLLELEGRHATEEELRLAHSGEHLERVRRWSREAEEKGGPILLSEGLVVSGPTWDASRAAAGCALSGVEAILRADVRNAFCASRPPGRDVTADEPGGFGFVNPVAVAARYLRVSLGVGRVLVVEWGGAAARGTAAILAGDPAVRVAAVHEASRATPGPFDAAESLAQGAAGEAFLAALDRALQVATEDFQPDFILLSAGFDGLLGDPVGKLGLAPLDYYHATVRLRDAADDWCAGRLSSVLEGGYDASLLGAAVVQHLRALARLPPA